MSKKQIASQKLEAENLANSARMNLLRARSNKQKAQIAKVHCELHQIPDSDEEVYYLDQAEEYRNRVKDCLEQYEVIQGKLFTNGADVTPLSKALNGQSFKTWVGYAIYFDFSDHGDIW